MACWTPRPPPPLPAPGKGPSLSLEGRCEMKTPTGLGRHLPQPPFPPPTQAGGGKACRFWNKGNKRRTLGAKLTFCVLLEPVPRHCKTSTSPRGPGG